MYAYKMLGTIYEESISFIFHFLVAGDVGGLELGTEEHCNNGQVDRAAKIKVPQVDLHWNVRVNYIWLSGPITQVISKEMQHPDGLVIEQVYPRLSITVKHALQSIRFNGYSLFGVGTRVEIQMWGGLEDYITLPQTCLDKCYVLTMVETTTGCLEIHPVSPITAQNTILEKQLMWLHSTTKRTELDNGTHAKNILIDTWASMILSRMD